MPALRKSKFTEFQEVFRGKQVSPLRYFARDKNSTEKITDWSHAEISWKFSFAKLKINKKN